MIGIKKFLNDNWLLIALFLLGIGIARSCVNNDQVPSIIDIPEAKNVTNNITKKEETIHTFEKQVFAKKETERMLEEVKQEMFAELSRIRQINDYPSIIRIQDSVIQIQESQIGELNGIIDLKDSVIIAQRYIINSKDTLISISKADAKKFKKQRNILFGVAVAELGVIILK